MNPIHILCSSLTTVALVSCASQDANEYDTSNPYGNPVSPADSVEPNPIYDTPAAYEETSSNAIPPVPGVDSIPPVPEPSPSTERAIIHTVVAGDTLSGLSSKYNVPISSIKAANRMTNDVVILGRKMVIPPR